MRAAAATVAECLVIAVLVAAFALVAVAAAITPFKLD